MSALSSASDIPSAAVRTMAPIPSGRIFSTSRLKRSRSSASSILREIPMWADQVSRTRYRPGRVMWLGIRAPLVPSGSLATRTRMCCPPRLRPPTRVGGPDAPPCPMDDCNEEPVAVHQEFGHQGPEVDRKARFLPRDRHREGLGCGELFPRLHGPAGGRVLRESGRVDGFDPVGAMDVEAGEAGTAGGHKARGDRKSGGEGKK